MACFLCLDLRNLTNSHHHHNHLLGDDSILTSLQGSRVLFPVLNWMLPLAHWALVLGVPQALPIPHAPNSTQYLFPKVRPSSSLSHPCQHHLWSQRTQPLPSCWALNHHGARALMLPVSPDHHPSGIAGSPMECSPHAGCNFTCTSELFCGILTRPF